MRKLLAELGSGETSGGVVSRLAPLQDRVGQVEQRIARLRSQREAVQQERLDEAEAGRALAGLDPAWEMMTPDEQARVVHLLVSRVDYDGARGKVSITFHPLGLKTLAGDMLGRSSRCVHPLCSGSAAAPLGEPKRILEIPDSPPWRRRSRVSHYSSPKIPVSRSLIHAPPSVTRLYKVAFLGGTCGGGRGCGIQVGCRTGFRPRAN